MSKTRLYGIWVGMLGRVYHPSNASYEYYGAKGVTVCEEWHKFLPFADWALANGYREDLTLDRKDTTKGYSPDNCKWATPTQQARNKSNNVWINYEGERICQADLARRLGLGEPAIRYRVKKGKLKLWEDSNEAS